MNRFFGTIVAMLILAVALASGPVVADTVTTGTSSRGWSGAGSHARTNACDGAKRNASTAANCSAGTLTTSACSCSVENSRGDAVYTNCTVSWTCTISSSEEDDE